ncbi:unnamed protein product [Bemisia tabaci]|uniref:Cystatin domain-containing protein n=1 Tax=Bemisia tabaci TaxID=7038 RepID=A0A9P0A2C7_BEMTA|nr:unnamed protein product [Bemisia tabaci]
MFLAKTTIFALVVATVLVEGSPVNSDYAETTTQFLPGGLKPVDTNDARVQELAKFSLSELKSSLGTSENPQMVKVTKAYKQVVAGTMYHITYEVSIPNGAKKSCTVKVWEQPWISQVPKVTEVTCDDTPSS